MKSRTLDELMIVNPGWPAETRTMRLRVERTPVPRGAKARVDPNGVGRLFLGSDGIVYRVERFRGSRFI